MSTAANPGACLIWSGQSQDALTRASTWTEYSHTPCASEVIQSAVAAVVREVCVCRALDARH